MNGEEVDLSQVGGIGSLRPPRFRRLAQLGTNAGEDHVPVRPDVLWKLARLEAGTDDKWHHVDVDPGGWGEGHKIGGTSGGGQERVHQWGKEKRDF